MCGHVGTAAWRVSIVFDNVIETWTRWRPPAAGGCRTPPTATPAVTRATSRPPTGGFAGQGPSWCTWWQVKDSNLRSFRDGFTVHSHWPLGQPAWCAWKDSKPDRTHRIDWRTRGGQQLRHRQQVRQAGGGERGQHRSQGGREPLRLQERGRSHRAGRRGHQDRGEHRGALQGGARRGRDLADQAGRLAQAPRHPRGRAAPVGQGVQARHPAQGGHLLRAREEDHQAHPRRGAQGASRPRSRATRCGSRASRATTCSPCSGCSTTPTSRWP